MTHVSATPATEWLKHHQITFTEHVYDYVEHGGTTESSRQLGVDEHHVVKTLVMQDDQGKGLVVLMHGDCKVGRRGFLVGIDPQVLITTLKASPVDCAIAREDR